MADIRIRPEQLAGALAAHRKESIDAIRRGARRGALRGQAHLVAETDARGVTDRGLFKNSWAVEKLPGGDGVVNRNSAPHAGIVELGARPHKVNAAGIEALTGWARRKLGADPKEARSIAFAIAKRIEQSGQPPTFIVRDNMDDLTRIASEEIVSTLREVADQPPRGGP